MVRMYVKVYILHKAAAERVTETPSNSVKALGRWNKLQDNNRKV